MGPGPGWLDDICRKHHGMTEVEARAVERDAEILPADVPTGPRLGYTGTLKEGGRLFGPGIHYPWWQRAWWKVSGRVVRAWRWLRGWRPVGPAGDEEYFDGSMYVGDDRKDGE